MDVTLKADTGRVIGTRSSRRLRAEGFVPATVYGLGKDPVSVAVEWPELRRVLTTEAGLNALIDLEVAGEHDLTIIKDLQRHPIRRDVIHVDFLRIDPNVEVVVDVPIALVGTPEALERRGGIVDQALYALTVRTKPGAIPTQLELDVSGLDIGTTITVSEVVLPADVVTDVDPDAPVVSGTASRATLEAERAATGGDAAADGEGGGADDSDAAGDTSGEA